MSEFLTVGVISSEALGGRAPETVWRGRIAAGLRAPQAWIHLPTTSIVAPSGQITWATP